MFSGRETNERIVPATYVSFHRMSRCAVSHISYDESFLRWERERRASVAHFFALVLVWLVSFFLFMCFSSAECTPFPMCCVECILSRGTGGGEEKARDKAVSQLLFCMQRMEFYFFRHIFAV